jgi:hypothetical protein
MHRIQGQPPLNAAADREEEATGAVRARNRAETQAEKRKRQPRRGK